MPTVAQDQKSTLALPYGLQMTQGRPVYYEKQGDRTAFIVLLGKAGLDGINRARYGGSDLAEFDASGDRQWKFHSGEAGTDEPDAFFPHLGWNGSGRSFAEVKLPAQYSDEGEPTRAQFWLRGMKTKDYSAAGAELSGGAKSMTRNNARVVADLFVVQAADYWARRGVDPKQLIEWSSWFDFKTECDGQISWDTGNGLRGQYYDDITLTTLKLTRTDAQVDFDWSSSSPANEVATDTFSVRWTGKVTPEFTETYTFYVRGDDGFRLWVNGVQLVNDWADGAVREQSGAIALAAGVEYDLVLEYYQQTGPSTIQLSWSSASRAKQIVPQARLAAGARTATRYTADVVFTSRTPLEQAVRDVMARAPGATMQFVNGKWRFLPTPSRAPVHRLTFDTTQTAVRPNIVEGSFEAFRRHPEEKPRELVVKYRNEEDLYFESREVKITRPDYVGEPTEVTLGVCSQSLAERTGESLMRRLDLDLFYRVTAFPDSYKAAKGDVLEASNSVYGWLESAPAEFMAVEERLKANDLHEFLLQIYSDQYYSDTDHGQLTVYPRSDIPSPFSAPPRVASVSLTLGVAVDGAGVWRAGINGVATFAEFGYPQQARVYLKLEGEGSFSVVEDKLVVPDRATLLAAFSIPNLPEGEHEVKVVTESAVGVTRGPADADAYSIDLVIPTPDPPTGYTITHVGRVIEHRLAALPGHTYDFAKSPGASFVTTGDADGSYDEYLLKVGSWAAPTKTRYARAQRYGKYSTWVLAENTAAAPPAAASLTGALRPDFVEWVAGPPVYDVPVEEYVWKRADGTTLATTKTPRYLEPLPAEGTASSEVRLYTKDYLGQLSASYVSAAVSLDPALATPTLTTDAANDFAGTVSLHVATASDRANVRYTRVQVRAAGGSWPSTAEGTNGQVIYAGAPKEVWAVGPPGQASEIRVGHETAAGTVTWSITLSHTFRTGFRVNVRDYGASPSATGAANREAFRRALAAAHVLGWGLYIPAGKYMVEVLTGTEFLLVEKALQITGDGVASEICMTSTTPTTVDVFRFVTYPTNPGHESFIFCGFFKVSSENNASARHVLHFAQGLPAGHNMSRVTNVYAAPTGGYFVYAPNPTASWDRFRNCVVEFCENWGGVFIEQGGDSIGIYHNLYQGGNTLHPGIAGRLALDVSLTDGATCLEVHHNTSHMGFRFGDGGYNTSLVGNIVEVSDSAKASGGACVHFAGASYNKIRAAVARDNTLASIGGATLNGLRVDHCDSLQHDQNVYNMPAGVGWVYNTADSTGTEHGTCVAHDDNLGGGIIDNAAANSRARAILWTTFTDALVLAITGSFNIVGGIASHSAVSAAVSWVLNLRSAAHYSNLLFKESGAVKAYVQYMGSANPDAARAGNFEVGNDGGGEIDFRVVTSRWRVKTNGDLVSSGGKVRAAGGLGVGNSAAATTPGSVVRKIQVFDADGNSIGFLAVFDNIT